MKKKQIYWISSVILLFLVCVGGLTKVAYGQAKHLGVLTQQIDQIKADLNDSQKQVLESKVKLEEQKKQVQSYQEQLQAGQKELADMKEKMANQQNDIQEVKKSVNF